MLLLGLVLLAVTIRTAIGVWESWGGDGGNPDFFGPWSAARLAAERPAAGVYDIVTLNAFQRELRQGFTQFYPFPYPPPMLLLLAPFGRLDYTGAHDLFLLATLVPYLALVAAFAARRWPDRLIVVLCALIAPASSYNAFLGQNGWLFAIPLLGGLLALPARPVLAGVLFGLLVCKPQLGLLLPVALLAARAWRAIAATAVSAATLAVVSMALYGADIWIAWAASGEALWQLYAENRPTLLPLMASPAAGLSRLGLPPILAMTGQVVCSLAVVGGVWLAFRRGASRAAGAVLLAGMGLASPYGFVYDLPAVTAAIAFLYFSRGPTGTFHIAELLILIAAFLAPAILLHPDLTVPVVALALVALFVVATKNALAPVASNAAPDGRDNRMTEAQNEPI